MKIPDDAKPYLALIAFAASVLAASVVLAKIFIFLGIT